jgi:metallo-beta-lactamase class B
MRTMRLWVACLVVFGLPAPDPVGQTPGGGRQGESATSQAGASRAARLQKERDNLELQKVPPFKAFDNLYYVGVGWVGSWLVTTNQGLILIDTLEDPYVDRALDNIKTVGFDPRDIKYVLISHGHNDHVGGAARIQEAYGAKVVMMEGDWKLLEGIGGAAPKARVPRRDLVVKDGDTLTLGSTTLRFYSHPGHTPGGLSIDFTVYDGGKPFQAFLFPGAAPGPGLQAAEQFLASVNSLERLQDRIQVRVVTHPWMDPAFWDRVDALAQRRPGAPHPFVAPEVFRAWIQELKAAGIKRLEEDKAKASSAAPRN